MHGKDERIQAYLRATTTLVISI